MRTVFIFLLLITLNTVNSQSKEYKTTIDLFQQYYNNKDAQAIYNMFDDNMKEAVSLKSMEAIITSFQSSYGNLNSTEFVEKKGTVEVYLGVFKNGKQHINISLNKENQINGLLFKPIQDREAKITRNSTPLQLPFKGDWFVVWGGDTKAQNYHVISQSQKNAFDFLIIGKNNKTYERSGTRNEDYFAFGKPLYAVCDATIITVIDGILDNAPGNMNPKNATGNTVILKTENEEYIVYAHFENETIVVKEGDTVKKGQYLGNCGNSGNSTEPHLHLHIQDGPNLLTSIGVKCYFEELIVKDETKLDYSPVRLDVISRIEN